MRVSTYLAGLILTCLFGAYGVNAFISGQFSQVSRVSEDFSASRLWVSDLERLIDSSSQYLVSADLVFASGQTYLVAGTLEQGERLSKAADALTTQEGLIPTEVPVKKVGICIQRINDLLRSVAFSTQKDRDQLLGESLTAYDEYAMKLAGKLESVLTDSESGLAEKERALAELHRTSERIGVVANLIFGVLLLVLWFLATRRIVNPLQTLRDNANLLQDGMQVLSVTRGPTEIVELSEHLHRLTDELTHQATHDALTNLHNRRAFERFIGIRVQAAEKRGKLTVLCMIDLDRFKAVNDSCGHAAGDELLTIVSGLLCRHVREGDFVARLGGDEFALILPDCDLPRGLELAREVRDAVRELEYHWQGEVFHISASIGVSLIEPSGCDASEVIQSADMACIRAKESGRDQVYVFDANEDHLLAKQNELKLSNDISNAIDAGELLLYAQPIVPVATNSAGRVNYEVLVRMKGRDGKLLSPGIFVPLAERYNLITRMDIWVVDQVMCWLETNRDLLTSVGHISVNLSGQSLGSSRLREFLLQRLGADAELARSICFEITETSAVLDHENASALMEELRSLGCALSLDDFGSGMSSFGYLRSMPVDYIKIDGCFVKSLVEDPLCHATVRAIDSVAKALGKKTVAEFVENAAIVEKLRELGVDYAQGYHCGRPAPIQDVVGGSAEMQARPIANG